MTRSYFGSTNFFGGPLEISSKTDKRLIQLEAQDDSAMLVFLSDVWLDKPEVTTRLKRLFLGNYMIKCKMKKKSFDGLRVKNAIFKHFY